MKRKKLEKYISEKDFVNQKQNTFLWKYKIGRKYLDRKRKVENEKYIKTKLKDTEDFFNQINGYSLDTEQRKAILTEEDSTLIVAGAGSGKTLTMVGKIKYLIEINKIDPSKILCLSFTNATVKDFKKAISKELKKEIDVLTFHQLGIKILSMNSLPIQIVEENYLEKVVEKYFDKRKLDFGFVKELKRYFPIKKSSIVEICYKLQSLSITFINLLKANAYHENDFVLLERKAKNEKNRILKNRNLFLLSLFKDIYAQYEKKLETEGKIDFHDMINMATDLIKEGYKYPIYEYIIVDEYQDTSYTRYLLLKELKEKNHCPLLVVGDDWQSIYRFTGCNVQLFIDFRKYFPYGHTMKLKNTYRNSQQLIDVASHFIMKNPNQLKKQLISKKTLKKPIQLFYYEQEKEFLFLLEIVCQQSQEKNGDIFILGRNNRDFDFLKKLKECTYKEGILIYNKYPEMNIQCMTVHKSKGLECERVIILNLKNKMTGFPSQIEDDSVLCYMKEKTKFLYDEERRLFYVALTRTKNEVYLFVPKKKPSLFVEELWEENKKDIQVIKKERGRVWKLKENK